MLTTLACSYVQTRPKVISSSLNILLYLSDTEQCKQIIHNNVRLICHAMMVNIQCKKTQMAGCKLLCFASSFIEITAGTTFLEAVVYAMISHCESESIQLSGCEFLSTCSYHFRFIKDSSDFDNMIVDAVIDSMENFPTLSKVQEQAMVALESFLSNQKLLNGLRSRSSRVIRVVHNAMTLSDSVSTFERGSDIMRVCKISS